MIENEKHASSCLTKQLQYKAAINKLAVYLREEMPEKKLNLTEVILRRIWDVY